MQQIFKGEFTRIVGAMHVVIYAHPQGCRGYFLIDPLSKDTLALDVHLDNVYAMAEQVKAEGWNLRFVVDTHTHADHPSGSRDLAAPFGSTRMAPEKANQVGVSVHLKDGDTIPLGNLKITVRDAPGHTPDSLALVIPGALFSGDSLFIGGVARTDFLGGNAGQLFDTIHRFLTELPDDTILFPGHDYQGKTESTLGKEKTDNPWLQIQTREEFVQKLIANPPSKPANLDMILRYNQEGVALPAGMSADEAIRFVKNGGAFEVIDVRTQEEVEEQHIPGSQWIPLDQIEARADEVMATPVPRLMLCLRGGRGAAAKKTLEDTFHVSGLAVVEGGLEAYVKSGGATVKGKANLSREIVFPNGVKQGTYAVPPPK
ncbi:MAG: MBL fold metallo-hydrolase [Candidatus Omnitrophota bacterium]